MTEQLAKAMGVSMHMAIDMAEALKLMKANDFDVFLFNCEVGIPQEAYITSACVQSGGWEASIDSRLE